MAIGVQTDMATPALARFGSDELRKEFLAPGDRGRPRRAASASAKPGAGSDVASIKTTARKDGGDYVINGAKMWITNSLQADWMCLLANTSEGAAHKNKSLIIVPMKTQGRRSVAKKIRKIGMMSSDTGLIHFDDVRVPQRYRIGEEGMGFTYQMQQFQEERLWAAAQRGPGSLSDAARDTIDYIARAQDVRPDGARQPVVHFRLAELKTEIEALRALTYRACELYVDGQDVTELASMAKLKAGACGARCRTPACSTGAAWASPGTTRSRGPTATGASARSAAAPTR